MSTITLQVEWDYLVLDEVSLSSRFYRFKISCYCGIVSGSQLPFFFFFLQGHLAKNPGTKRFKGLKQLNYNHCIILSGTPIQNSLKVRSCSSTASIIPPMVLYTSMLSGTMKSYGVTWCVPGVMGPI